MAGRVEYSGLRAYDAGRKMPPRQSLRVVARLLLQTLLLIALALPVPAAAAVKGTVTAAVENGFARLIFTMGDDVESQVHVFDSIIIINFDQPVDINVDRLAQGADGYIGAARRDPDGKAVRIALSRKAKVSSMAAGERLFVDLLPDGWTGLPPGLPRDVIEELARRAHDAEKKVRQEHPPDRDGNSKITPIRVRVASQPTFTRYIFDLLEPVGVSAENGKDKLTLTFSAALKFDLADAQANLPRLVQKLDSDLDQDSTVVRFAFGGKVDVRTFREDNSYVVDISSAELKPARKPDTKSPDGLAGLAADLLTKKMPAPENIETPRTVPAKATVDASKRALAAAATPVLEQLPPAAAVVPAAVVAVVPAPVPPVPVPVAAPPANDATPSPPAAPPAVPSSPDQAVAPPPDQPVAPSRQADRPAPAAAAGLADPNSIIKVVTKAQGDNFTLRFPFANPTSGAVFRRADTLWLVFDTGADIKLAVEPDDPSHNVRSATVKRQRDVAVVRIKLERPRLVSVAEDGTAWVVSLGSQIIAPTRPLTIARNGNPPSRPSAMILMNDPSHIHQIEDPEAGDTLMVATALPPARGFVSAQDFVEFRVLASAHGVVIQPLADDLKTDLTVEGIALSRPQGLSLTVASFRPESSAADDRADVINARSWAFDRKDEFGKRQDDLMFSAAKAPDSQRLMARIDLARFYLAWQMSAEAKGVLDVALKDDPPTAADSMPLVLRAVANIMLGRPQDALKDLSSPIVGNRYDAPLWRALAYARLGRWSDAHDGFSDVEPLLAALPLELQQRAMRDIVRTDVEVGDVTGAAREIREFESIGIPHELEPSMSIINGKLAEREGRIRSALQSYQSAGDSWDRPAAAQGQLRGIELQQSLGKLQRPEAIGDLETLTTIWRGDETETEALKVLAHLYTLEGRFRDAFHVMRAALNAHPDSEMTRAIQDEAAVTFENLFLAGRGDTLPSIDALALFYDFRELTPIGRRGDEMIRRLSDRLVTVDLLDQAADLLQYQVDNRLQGAARAQVATRLAVIDLMNHRPDRALTTLRASRVENLSNELREQRLMIEARALSESGRRDVALEVVENIDGPEAIRLRADILWAAKRWREAAEQIELLYGDRWKEFAPLNDVERSEILRAAAGYALGEDPLGLGRFRERYVGKMGTGPDQRIFNVLTQPVDASGTDFRAVAHAVAAVDTLGDFLRDLRERFPDVGLLPAKVGPPAAEPPATQTLPPPVGPTAAR